MTDAMPAVSEVHGADATPREEQGLEPAQGLDDSRNTSTPATVGPQTPDVIHYEYEPLLQRLQTDCRRIVATAHSEAEAIRNEAREESRRRVSSAHREEAMILSRAAEQQAAIYRDTQNEVDRRLDELEQARVSVLAAARAEAEEMRRSAKDAEDRAHAALQSTDEEARAIVARAHEQARNVRGLPTTTDDEERVFWSAHASNDLDELLQDIQRNGTDAEPADPSRVHDSEPGDADPPETAPSATGVDLAPTVRRVRPHRRSHWWSPKR